MGPAYRRLEKLGRGLVRSSASGPPHVSKAASADVGKEAREVANDNDEVDGFAKCAQAPEMARASAQGALKIIGAFAVHARFEGMGTDTTSPPRAERLLGSLNSASASRAQVERKGIAAARVAGHT